ncbi:hypothetical protein ACQKMW_18245 [Pseudomonas sivasensis]|uniref:hypothetical protein n=1 Tax=Pseudomonas sivasensis TaxID=1880678 RepID=UPI003D0031C5
MSKDGMLDPLEGLSSPVGMGTLAVAIALTRAVQVLAGKDSKVVDVFLQDALNSKIFENASAEVQQNFKAPIEKALKETQATRDMLSQKN